MTSMSCAIRPLVRYRLVPAEAGPVAMLRDAMNNTAKATIPALTTETTLSMRFWMPSGPPSAEGLSST